jgi:Panthothenate synthetase
LNKKKDKLANIYNIDIEYLELRNITNLKKTNNIKNSKIFIAYYLNNVRLIDNF